MCHSRQQAEEVKAAWQHGWRRGLSFNEDKTKIVHVEGGFRSWGATSAATST